MGEYKDQRAVSDIFISDLNNKKKLGVFTDFVRTHSDTLQMCFRGNNNQETVIIYRNNHKVWEIVKHGGRRTYKIGVSFNHARYCEQLTDILDAFFKLGFNRKTLEDIKKANGYIYTKYYGEYNNDFVQETYKLINKMFECYFDYGGRSDGKQKEKDWIKVASNSEYPYTNKRFLVEKIKQQELYYKIFDGQKGYYAYDLEFSQKYPSRKKANWEDIIGEDGGEENDFTTHNKKTNQPDMLAVRPSENGMNLVLIEVKSLKKSCENESGVIKHLDGMIKYIEEIIRDEQGIEHIVLEDRKKDALRILDAYKALKLRQIDDIGDKKAFVGIEVMLVFTDTKIDAKYHYNSSHNSGYDLPAYEWINDSENKAELRKEIDKYPNIRFTVKNYIDGELIDVVF